MPKFTVNAQRSDPYRNLMFQVWWDGRLVAAMSKCSALKRTTEVVKSREGNDPSTARHNPGASSFEAITLERGVTHDPEFEKWANLVYDVSGPGSISLKNCCSKCKRARA